MPCHKGMRKERRIRGEKEKLGISTTGTANLISFLDKPADVVDKRKQ